MGRTRHRPRRGEAGPNVLVEGDTGEYAGPQGGARKLKQAFMESGDLESREYGVPEADLPGGKPHIVNPEAVPARTPAKPQRPADYHKHHGVPSDNELYDTPDADLTRAARPLPEPQFLDPVPVYIVEAGAGKRKTRRVAYTDTITLPPVGQDPARLCNTDDERDEVMLLCTSGSNNALFSDSYSSLASATTTSHGGCGFLSNTATSYTRIATQENLWATSDSASESQVAVVIVTEVLA